VYLDHWSLKQPPFEPQPDSRFLLPTRQHAQALAAATYAAREGGEPVLLTGDPGCGKTLVLRAHRRQLPREQFHVVFVPEVTCAEVGLLRRVAHLVTRALLPDTAQAMDACLQFVSQAEQERRQIVLMLDDWSAKASPRDYDELRWLLNLDTAEAHPRVLLSGTQARAADFPAWLRQRLCVTVELRPLPAEGVPEYLSHRLRIAGRDGPELFTTTAAARIAEWSAGVPRLVNRLAHLALHVGYLDAAQRIEAEAVEQAISRLAPQPCIPANTEVPA